MSSENSRKRIQCLVASEGGALKFAAHQPGNSMGAVIDEAETWRVKFERVLVEFFACEPHQPGGFGIEAQAVFQTGPLRKDLTSRWYDSDGA